MNRNRWMCWMCCDAHVLSKIAAGELPLLFIDRKAAAGVFSCVFKLSRKPIHWYSFISCDTAVFSLSPLSTVALSLPRRVHVPQPGADNTWVIVGCYYTQVLLWCVNALHKHDCAIEIAHKHSYGIACPRKKKTFLLSRPSKFSSRILKVSHSFIQPTSVGSRTHDLELMISRCFSLTPPRSIRPKKTPPPCLQRFAQSHSCINI